MIRGVRGPAEVSVVLGPPRRGARSMRSPVAIPVLEESWPLVVRPLDRASQDVKPHPPHAAILGHSDVLLCIVEGVIVPSQLHDGDGDARDRCPFEGLGPICVSPECKA